MRNTADSLTDGIVELARNLVHIPSRAGKDPPQKIVDFVANWCVQSDLPHTRLEAAGRPVGICSRVYAGQRGRSLCLDACLDTAPFGDTTKWTHTPTAGAVLDGRLFGRGAADSKVGAAIFLTLAREFHHAGALKRGELNLLLDADEHTGEFRGAKEFIRHADRKPEAVWIGYPGNQTIVAGSRGFLRARLSVAGMSAHSGSKRRKGINAVARAARLVVALERVELPPEPAQEFSFGPSLAITAIHGGEGFSVIPDLCELNLDIRLTPSTDPGRTRQLIERSVVAFDAEVPGPHSTGIRWEESWPAFRVPDTSPTIACLRSAGERVFGRPIPTVVSGPSNIGNYLSALGISTMAGFGVTYDNVHAVDEWCDVSSIRPVYETYRQAVLAFLDTTEEAGLRPAATRVG